MRSSTLPRAAHVPRTNRNLINVVALLLALCWLVLLAVTLTTKFDDFTYHRLAARNLMQSGNPYVPLPDRGGESPYAYPPLFAFLVQPLGLLDQATTQWIWYGCNVLFLSAFAFVCIRLTKSELVRQYWGIMLLGAVVAPPVRLSLQLGQVSILLALLMVLGFATARRSTGATGILLALASIIKLYPAALGAYYLLRGPRKVILWSVVAGIFLLALPLPWYGLAPYAGYFAKMRASTYYPYAADFNISIIGFTERLFSATRYAVPIIDAPVLARASAVVGLVVVFAGCIWSSWRQGTTFGYLLQFNVWLCGMMLLSPSNGYYNLVLLLLPLLTALRYLEIQPDRGVRNWLVIATALACIPPAWSNWHEGLYQMTHVGWGLLLLTPSIYGLVIYFMLFIHLVRRDRDALNGAD